MYLFLVMVNFHQGNINTMRGVTEPAVGDAARPGEGGTVNDLPPLLEILCAWMQGEATLHS